MQRAGFLVRFLALIIDILIIISVHVCVVYLYANFTIEGPFSWKKILELLGDKAIQDRIKSVNGALAFLYAFIGEVIFSGTLGKTLLGLQIGTVDGYRASRTRRFLRFIIKSPLFLGVLIFLLLSGIGMMAFQFSPSLSVTIIAVAGVIFALSGIANFMMFFGCFLAIGDSRQALHDRAAETAVYHGKLSDRGDPQGPMQGNNKFQSQHSSNRAVNELIFK